MSSQFYHVNAYGRQAGKGKEGKHTIDSIIDEAERQRGSYPHIQCPAQPVLLYGCSPHEAGESAKRWAENSLDAQGHKLRKDARCLLAGVISVPEDFKDSLWLTYKEQTIDYLKGKYGTRLKSVVEHTDETYRHIHFFVVANPGDRFDTIHEGIKAQNAANPDRGKKDTSKQKIEKQIDRKLGNYAYAEAMRKVQDDFWINVSSRFGLSRIGPKRRRLTRKEVREQKQRENEIAKVYEKVEQLKTSLTEEFSTTKQLLQQQQERVLQRLQAEYLERQKGLMLLETATKEDHSKALIERAKAQELISTATIAKRVFDQGKEILYKKLDSLDFDENNIPKPKILESAQKYVERSYDEMKWIAQSYKKQVLDNLPKIAGLQDKLEKTRKENLMKDEELQNIRSELLRLKNSTPEELMEMARQKQIEIERRSYSKPTQKRGTQLQR